MRVYKIELMIIDYNEIEDDIKDEIECTEYGNNCISPKVINMEFAEIGEWHDNHPLNDTVKFIDEYNRLFSHSELIRKMMLKQYVSIKKKIHKCSHGLQFGLDYCRFSNCHVCNKWVACQNMYNTLNQILKEFEVKHQENNKTEGG